MSKRWLLSGLSNANAFVRSVTRPRATREEPFSVRLSNWRRVSMVFSGSASGLIIRGLGVILPTIVIEAGNERVTENPNPGFPAIGPTGSISQPRTQTFGGPHAESPRGWFIPWHGTILRLKGAWTHHEAGSCRTRTPIAWVQVSP